jgi:hypothetical protein
LARDIEGAGGPRKTGKYMDETHHRAITMSGKEESRKELDVVSNSKVSLKSKRYMYTSQPAGRAQERFQSTHLRITAVAV